VKLFSWYSNMLLVLFPVWLRTRTCMRKHLLNVMQNI